MNNSVDRKKYVVLDVETNGLNSKWCDLLSISFYRPDNGFSVTRFLPLEINKKVYTTYINGITKLDLKGKKPLSQEEVDELIKDFELDRRIILTYGNIDRTFLAEYFKRHGLEGIQLFRFYNFKRSIISSPYSGGVVTKDSLCKMFGIEGVTGIHSGENDCRLEWRLFEKMNNEKLFIDGNYCVYRFSDDYIIPSSYLACYPNFKYHSNSCVDVAASYKVLKRFEIRSSAIKKFENNINGVAIEHLLSTLLGAKDYKKDEKKKFLLENKHKLKYVGRLFSPFYHLLVRTNEDGSLSAINKRDREKIRQINAVLDELRKDLSDLVAYLNTYIFKGKSVRYQELIVNRAKKTLALCDFSSEDSIVEMKAYGVLDNNKRLASQLYYQFDGRDIYILSIDWRDDGVDFVITKVEKLEAAEKRIQPLICTIDPKKSHHKKLASRKTRIRANKKAEKVVLTEEQKKEKRLKKYRARVAEFSNNTIEILEYTDSRSDTLAKCLRCGHVWSARSDKIPYRGCPNCRKAGNM